MNKRAFVCAALAAASTFTLSGEDFPLAFKKIPAQEVMSFPGGYGSYAMMAAGRPTGIHKEPKAVSRHPLYAHYATSLGDVTFLARLDESKGDGKGYDQLIVDVNQNGDLTDDPVAARVTLPRERSESSPEQVLFGPIEVPGDKTVAGGRPVFFAQTYSYSRTLSVGGRSMSYNAPLRLKAGWYLEKTVELDGVKQKVGVYDANANLRLGDLAKPRDLRGSGSDSNWYFQSGDVWLVDANGSGKFESDAVQSESVPFGPLLWLGSKPCKVSLASDCTSMRVEPWPDALAEVSLQPRGSEVRSLTLAWEQPQGQWQLIRPAVTESSIRVPPGNYRLYGCALVGGAGTRDQVMVSATERVPRTPFRFALDKANTLRCGAPLQVKVTASRGSTGSALSGLFERDSYDTASDSTTVLRINASVVGAEGEVYSTFLCGEKLNDNAPKPTFTILDSRGQQLACGNLEYG